MIGKPAFAALLSSGLVIPENPALVFPKPAIVQAENLDLSRHMLLGMPLTMGMLAPKAAGPLTATYQSSTFSNSDLTTYSFTSMGIGTASADRYILLVIGSRDTGNNSLSSATVAGQATTILYTSGSTTDPRAIVITDAPVTSGTTATVSITWSNGSLRTGVGVYSITGGVPSLVADYGASGTVTTATGGCVIAGGYNNGNSNSVTMSNLTVDASVTLEGPNLLAVGSTNITTGGTLSVTISAVLDFIVSLSP